MPRFRRRRSMTSTVQSFKKVLNHAPASFGAGSRTLNMTTGTDSVAAGQTSPTDSQVPTGAILKFIEIQISYGQISGGAVFAHCSIQLLRANQTAIASNVVGGNPQRNQVFHQMMYQLGINQNFNRTIKFRIPKKFGRVREGDKWIWEITSSGTLTQAHQFIYKFYR